jgi:hypothetical protein
MAKTTTKIKSDLGDLKDVAAPTGGEGNGSVTTAGTRVQLSTSSVPCRRVKIECNESNGDLTNHGTIVVGFAGVVAAIATRKGTALYPSQNDWFKTSNLNLIYIDSVDDGAKFHYIYEV